MRFTGAKSPFWFSKRITMTHDSTSHHIFRISELTRLIASQLILINPRDAVNLACACRYLEEPALCTLWEIQWSLCTLLRVLPEENWEIEYPKGGLAVRGLDVLLEKRSAQVRGYSSRLWGIRHQRPGKESGVTRLGCAEST